MGHQKKKGLVAFAASLFAGILVLIGAKLVAVEAS
jgi:hypothetical protein